MRRPVGVVVILGLLVVWSGSWLAAAERVTVASVLDEMTDLAALAELPDPPFTCKQFGAGGYDTDLYLVPSDRRHTA